MRIATSRATLSPSNRIEEEHMNRIPFVFATAVVATAAGCGSQASPTLTKAQVISRGSAICKHAEQEVDRTTAADDAASLRPGDVESRTPDGAHLPRRLREGSRRLSHRPCEAEGSERRQGTARRLPQRNRQGRGRAAGCSDGARPASRIGSRQGVHPLRQREREHRVVRLRQGGLRLRELELDMMGPCQPSSVSSPSTSADLT